MVGSPCFGGFPRARRAERLAFSRCRKPQRGTKGTACGDLEYRSHACTHRPCPTCQHDEATRWLAQQRALLLPVPSLLVTLTLPEALRPVTHSHQRLMDHLPLQPSSAALQALTLAPNPLGGGLHTWTRELAYPPHVHSLVPGGALSPDGSTWLNPRYKDWRVPVLCGLWPLTPLVSGGRQERHTHGKKAYAVARPLHWDVRLRLGRNGALSRWPFASASPKPVRQRPPPLQGAR